MYHIYKGFAYIYKITIFGLVPGLLDLALKRQGKIGYYIVGKTQDTRYARETIEMFSNATITVLYGGVGGGRREGSGVE